MTGMGANLKMYMLSQLYSWRSFTVYRTQAAVWLITNSLSTVASFITITIIYNVSSGIPGWNYFQLLALSSLANIALSLMNYNLTPRYVAKQMRLGALDPLLLKPYNPLLSILARGGFKGSIGNVLSGLVMLAYALAGLHATALQVAYIAVAFSLGTAAFLLFMVMLTLLSYVAFRSAGYTQWVINIAGRAAGYPLSIYGLAGMVLLTVGMPVGFASFYSASAIAAPMAWWQTALLLLGELGLSLLYYKISMKLMGMYTSASG